MKKAPPPKPTPAQIVGANIRRLREATGLTNQQISIRVGASNSNHVSKWATGRNCPQPDTIAKLAECFGVPIAEMFRE